MFKAKKKAERNNIFSQPLTIIHIQNALTHRQTEDSGKGH